MLNSGLSAPSPSPRSPAVRLLRRACPPGSTACARELALRSHVDGEGAAKRRTRLIRHAIGRMSRPAGRARQLLEGGRARARGPPPRLAAVLRRLRGQVERALVSRPVVVEAAPRRPKLAHPRNSLRGAFRDPHRPPRCTQRSSAPQVYARGLAGESVRAEHGRAACFQREGLCASLAPDAVASDASVRTACSSVRAFLLQKHACGGLCTRLRRGGPGSAARGGGRAMRPPPPNIRCERGRALPPRPRSHA